VLVDDERNRCSAFGAWLQCLSTVAVVFSLTVAVRELGAQRIESASVGSSERQHLLAAPRTFGLLMGRRDDKLAPRLDGPRSVGFVLDSVGGQGSRLRIALVGAGVGTLSGITYAVYRCRREIDSPFCLWGKGPKYGTLGAVVGAVVAVFVF
jgi:hypothetical protein